MSSNKQQQVAKWVVKLGLDLTEVTQGEKRVSTILKKMESLEGKVVRAAQAGATKTLKTEKDITTERKRQDQLLAKRIRAETAIRNLERRAEFGGLSGQDLEKAKQQVAALKAQVKDLSSSKDFAFFSRKVSRFSQEISKNVKENNKGLAEANALQRERVRLEDRLRFIERKAAMGGLPYKEEKLVNAKASGIRGQLGSADANRIRLLRQETSLLGQETNSYIATAKKLSSSTAGSTTAMLGLARAAGVVGAAFLSLNATLNAAKWFYNTAKELDSLKAGLLAASGGLEQSKEDFRFILQTSETLGVSLVAAANGFRQIGAAGRQIGFASEQTQEFFLAATEASRAFGLSADRTQLVYLAFSQILSKGKVSQEELRRQMGEQLPGVMAVAARSMGVTTAEFEKMIARGIDATEFMPKFSKELRIAAREGGALAASMNSITAAEQRFMTSLQKMANNEDFQEMAADFLTSMSYLVNALGPLVESIVSIVSGVAKPVIGIFEFISALVSYFVSIVKIGIKSILAPFALIGEKLSAQGKTVLWLKKIWASFLGEFEMMVGELELFAKHMSSADLGKMMLGIETEGTKNYQKAMKSSYKEAEERLKSYKKESALKASSEGKTVSNEIHLHGTPEENKHMMENMFQNWMTS